MIDTDFASPYYRIARFLQQVSGRNKEANWYFQKSIAKSKQSDFFVLYFQLHSLYEIFLNDMRFEGTSTLGQYNKNWEQFRKSQDAFNSITIGPAQKDYQKLNQVYEGVWNYVAQYFKPGSPIYNKKYFGNQEITEINDDTYVSISGRWYNLPFCPPGSEVRDTKTFDSGIAMYLRMLQQLNEIKDDTLAITVALRKAQIYEDLARLTHLRGWDLIQIPPELKEIRATVSLDQVYTNYHKVLERDSFEVGALEGLAENYALLGDFETSVALYRRLKKIKPQLTNQYMICLLNIPPSLENAQEVEVLARRKNGKRPEHLEKAYGITVMTKSDKNYDFEKQMVMHNLAFTYSALGERERLEEIQGQIFPVSPTKLSDFTQVAVAAYTSLISTTLALQNNDYAKAEACCRILWKALGEQQGDIKQAAKMGKFILPYLRHYRNPFLAPHNYQVMPQRLKKLAQNIAKGQSKFNSEYTNQIGIINQVLYYLEEDSEAHEKFSKIMKKVTGIDGAIFTVLYYLSNKSVDLMEIRLEKTSVSSSPETHYRRAVMFFRKFLQAKRDKKSPRRQHEYLKQARDTLLSAIFQNPSMQEYHYSLAVVAGYLSQTEKSYKELSIKHLKYAIQLGMRNRALVLQEPAFVHLKKESKWRETFQIMKKDPLYLEKRPLSSWQNHVEHYYARNQFKDVLMQTRLLGQKIDNAAATARYRAFLNLKSNWRQKFAENEDLVKQQVRTIFETERAEELIGLLEKD